MVDAKGPHVHGVIPSRSSYVRPNTQRLGSGAGDRVNVLGAPAVAFWAVLLFLRGNPFPIQAQMLGIPFSLLPFTTTAIALATIGLNWRRAMAIVPTNIPLALLIAYATTSSVMNNSGFFTVKYVVDWLGSYIFAIAIISSLRAHQLQASMFFSLTAAIMLSIIWVYLFPLVAVHQGRDGMWRGIFIHKNLLGNYAGACLALSVLFGRRFGGLLLQVVTVSVSAICVVKSQSATGVVVAMGVLAAGAGLRAIKTKGQFVALAAVMIVCVAVAQPLAELIIVDLLHKDLTFTGRTRIWEIGAEALDGHWLLGLGVGATDKGGEFMAALSGFAAEGVNHVHSGYLNLVANLGLLGLLLWLAAIVRAYRNAASVGANRLFTEFGVLACAPIWWLVNSISESAPSIPSNYAFSFCIIAFLMLAQPVKSVARPVR